MPVPGSPLPLLSVPDMREDTQVWMVLVVVSFSVVVPAAAVMAPPGRTVQAVAVAAAGDAAPGAMARAAAPASARAPVRARMRSLLPGRCACAHHNPGPRRRA